MDRKTRACRKSRKTLSIELKKAIIEASEKGEKQKNIATKFKLHKNTVQTILANKEKIKNAKVSKGVCKLHAESQRKNLSDEMEKLLLEWINERQTRGDPVSRDLICEKARFIYRNLKKRGGCPDEGAEEEFKGSRGWFHRFCKRTGIQSLEGQKAAEKFVEKLRSIVRTEGYLKQQLFGADETRLFWKKMPSRITEDETSGVRPSKNRLTLLLGANCSGDFELKPFLAYEAENPKPLKKAILKLPVMWKANEEASNTRALFKEWIFTVFAPSVKSYLEKNDLPLKALLILKSAPSETNLEKLLQESFPWLSILYLPPNTSALLQPMDQLIANLKKLYFRELFRNCYKKCQFSATKLSIKQFWKEEHNIVEAMKLLEKAWDQVTEKTLNSAYRALTPGLVSEKAVSDDDVVKEIIFIARELEMEVDEKDIEELIEDEQLAKEAQEKTFDDEKPKNPVPSSAIKKLLAMWEDVRKIVAEWHPDHREVNRVSDSYDVKVIHYFRDVLKKRKKQTSSSEPEFGKKPKTEELALGGSAQESNKNLNRPKSVQKS